MIAAISSLPVHKGQGLALHSAMMAVVGGTLAVESAPGAYTPCHLNLAKFRTKD